MCARLAASDKVYQVLAHGQWFSSGTPASSTTKTGRHDIVEILLKVALSTINKVKSNHTLNSSGNILYVVYNRFVVVFKYTRNGYPFIIYILDPVFMGFFCWKNNFGRVVTKVAPLNLKR